VTRPGAAPADRGPVDAPALDARGVRCSYGLHQVLHGVDVRVEAGEVVVLLGANGAGKSTLLRCLSGVLRYEGTVSVFGTPLTGAGAPAVVRSGVAQVPEGRGTFSALSVADNLRLGAYSSRLGPAEIGAQRSSVLELFPVLADRIDQQAGTLSGGEQQMLAIARALMSRPRLLLLDEPSLGLAPAITKQVFERLDDLRRRTGLSVLVVEQNAELSLAIADRGYVLQAGQVVASGTADDIRSDHALRRAYLGY
jgi:branched-chain amino acid transport system ATP-binding protein